MLRLTYTAHDMAPFARDLGYDGPPFTWDEEERRHLRARLDALYFHLYGLDHDDADYVLGTFPIVRRQDEAAFGSYRTRDLVLAYMNALAAGTPKRMWRCRDRRFASALPSAEARAYYCALPAQNGRAVRSDFGYAGGMEASRLTCFAGPEYDPIISFGLPLLSLKTPNMGNTSKEGLCHVGKSRRAGPERVSGELRQNSLSGESRLKS